MNKTLRRLRQSQADYRSAHEPVTVCLLAIDCYHDGREAARQLGLEYVGQGLSGDGPGCSYHYRWRGTLPACHELVRALDPISRSVQLVVDDAGAAMHRAAFGCGATDLLLHLPLPGQ